MLQEANVCLLCGSTDNGFFLRENGYELLKCERCELVFLGNKPSEKALNQTYNCESGKTFNRLSEQTERFEKRLEAKKRYKVISKYLNSGSGILELGCGGGYFLELLKNCGYRAVGLEVSDTLINFAKGVLKVDARNCGVGELVKQNEHFYAVILFEVLSHLHNPLATLKDLNKLIGIEGTLIVETGNGGEVEAPAQDKWGLPEHIYFFSKKSLVILLNKSGFKVVKVFRFNMWWQRTLLKIIANTKGATMAVSATSSKDNVLHISSLRRFLKNLISSILLFCRYGIGRINATPGDFCSMIVIAKKCANI